jgi:two-component system OmpR family sensor kinase
VRRLTRLPLRVRLTLGFAGAAAVLLAAAGTFIFFDVKAGLDGSLDANLASRATYLSRLAQRGDEPGLHRALETDNEPAQLLDARGRVVAASPVARGETLLTRGRLVAARRRETAFERAERTRLLARPVRDGRVVVVATSMVQRERALELLSAILLIGSPLILLLASGAGYLVATAALRPVERMRQRAAEISTATSDARLPLPPAEDELRRLGVTLNEMLERLAASAAGERAFLASASHELRTPLAILNAEVDLALTGPQTVDELRAALQSAGEEADRLIQLADDLLIVARGQEGRLPLTLDDIPVSDVLEDLASGYAALGVDRLRTDVDPGLVVRADRLRLDQALGNLVDNAFRHGSPPVRLHAAATGDGVEIHVVDNGVGFSDDALDAPLDGTPRASATGFGLGLAMVASIARAHGGSASTANTGAGADAWVTLPGSHPRAR